MEHTTLFALLDEYDAVWTAMHEEKKLSSLSNAELTKASSQSFRPLFMQIAEISFKIIEGYQQLLGTHAVPVLNRIDNRLDTAKIREQLAESQISA